jgi:hypothetical protein
MLSPVLKRLFVVEPEKALHLDDVARVAKRRARPALVGVSHGRVDAIERQHEQDLEPPVKDGAVAQHLRAREAAVAAVWALRAMWAVDADRDGV